MADAEREVWVEPGNPFDFDEDEVETLFREEEGYGVSASEVVLVWLSFNVAKEAGPSCPTHGRCERG